MVVSVFFQRVVGVRGVCAGLRAKAAGGQGLRIGVDSTQCARKKKKNRGPFKTTSQRCASGGAEQLGDGGMALRGGNGEGGGTIIGSRAGKRATGE